MFCMKRVSQVPYSSPQSIRNVAHHPTKSITRNVSRPLADVGARGAKGYPVGQQPEAGHSMKPEAIEIDVDRFGPAIRLRDQAPGAIGREGVGLPTQRALQVAHEPVSAAFDKGD